MDDQREPSITDFDRVAASAMDGLKQALKEGFGDPRPKEDPTFRSSRVWRLYDELVDLLDTDKVPRVTMEEWGAVFTSDIFRRAEDEPDAREADEALQDYRGNGGKPFGQVRAELGLDTDMVPPSWQPIETAPKDGTAVLVYVDGCFACAVWSDCWSGQGREPEGWTDGEYRLNPTHWMPLPDPPSARLRAYAEGGES